MSKDFQQQRKGPRRVEIEELRNVKTHKDSSRKEHRLVLVGAGYANVRRTLIFFHQITCASIMLLLIFKQPTSLSASSSSTAFSGQGPSWILQHYTH